MGKIAKDACQKYTKIGFHNLHAKVGDAGLKAIYEHDLKAAKVVSKLTDCDQVFFVAYSESRSTYPNELVSFVDCTNGRRFYVQNGVIID
ncbi:hypothetical protein P255_02986 [Acinetobacter brisouii CIP 110357]|uniref:Uncharacterized protein n=1 Tax=Acinetobacter brisouii CIP 110357 TaxID=1341683 RepID=V2VIZ8_9GAMM|nr:hypothetical protein [Acinetobacter brisouii]ENV46181.1 hypothetical protein F954_02816 [Acinetobacter brisouii ANC 4119]ESK47504.1 hypothetical protein P255_02986 [Acinetobacter brisouii CIP 110357]